MSNIWSVRGVAPELRRAVLQAATADGVTVGEWLSKQLTGLLSEQHSNNLSDPDVTRLLDSCLSEIDTLETALREHGR